MSERSGRRAAATVPRPGSYENIYTVIRRIPRGRVATYGQVAELAGLGSRAARQVGYALHALGRSAGSRGTEAVEIASRVPWHRVVNARGQISARSDPDLHVFPLQRLLLEEEGVMFDPQGRIDLAGRRWRPRGSTR